MRRTQLLLIAAALPLAGCSATIPTLGLPSPEEAAASLPSPEPAGAPHNPLAAMVTPKPLVSGTPTEVYTRIARGVLTCWFGADGPLKSRYIYHAEAAPAHQGGNSEIKIMTRDHEAEDPRALRAYKIAIAPSEGGSTRVEVENVRLAEPLAVRLEADVNRWSAAEEGCGDTPVTAGWAAEPGAAPTAENKKNSKK